MTRQETSRRKWLVIAGSVAAVVAGLWLLTWWMQNLSKVVLPGTQIGHTSSMETVEIAVEDSAGRSLRMRVPKAYLVLRENWRGGTQSAIWMEAALPDMKPARAIPKLVGSAGSPEYERALSAMNNGVWLRLESTRRDMTKILANRRRDLSNAERVPGAPRAYDVVADTKYGLQRFREKRCWLSPEQQTGAAFGETCLEHPTDHYVVAGDDGPPVYIVCDLSDADYVGPRVGCEATTAFDGFALTYNFRHSQLGRWREFDEAVRRLLSTFVIDLPLPLSPSASGAAESLLYRTLIHLDSQVLNSGAQRHELLPGMRVSAEIQLGTRSVMEYLFSPITKAFHEAGRER